MQAFNPQSFPGAAAFLPSSADVAYERMPPLKISLIMRMDSYKFSHPFAYPTNMNIQGSTSYGEPRVPYGDEFVVFGMQYLLNAVLAEPITAGDVEDARRFANAHFGTDLFAYNDWMKVVNEYDGHLPLIIRAVPEGTVIRGGMPAYTTTVIDGDLHWMGPAFETVVQRGQWYPSTIITNDYITRKMMWRYYEMSGASEEMFNFSLHDFGGRGASCGEQAQIGGAAHLASGYMGSDTIEGILTANHFYECNMAGFSVYATEHSIECSFGPSIDGAREYIRTQLRTAKERGLKVISIVIDGHDVMREAGLLCTEFKDEIIASGVKVVFRPDSGDMMDIVPRILELQAATFGVEMTAKGYRRIKYVGVLQGDGVDRLAIANLLGKVVVGLNFSADCVIFGSGGALLQKVNRDTYNYAQKLSALLVDGQWVGTPKDPITDPGKRSKEGVLTTLRHKMTGELMVGRLDLGPIDSEWEDIMEIVYFKGQLYNKTNLEQVRSRCSIT